MKIIPLTRGKYAVVDNKDYARVSKFRWHAQHRRRRGAGVWYARRSTQTGRGTTRKIVGVYLHTFLTGFRQVDHKNGDGLDNRRRNLRPCSKSQNIQNARKRQGTSSRFKGVERRLNNRWSAKIRLNNVRYSLGCFDTEELAARVYDSAARSFFGEFARCNFPEN